MNEAIKLAVEKGGYDTDVGLFNLPDFSPYDKKLIYPFLVSDPLFWQALVKALNWWEPAGDEDCGGCETCERLYGYEHSRDWLKLALRHYELSLTGGDTEAFWKDLLKPNN